MGKDTQTTVERIITTILAGIENGTFTPGNALPAQRQLAEYFNVSRNVIREAVKVLEGSGILYSKQGSGIYVKSPLPLHSSQKGTSVTQYTLRQILDLCRIIWHASMIPVVQNASCEDLERLQKMNENLINTYSTATNHQKFIYESSFGMNICQLAKNPLATTLLQELLKVTTEIDYIIIGHPQYPTVLQIDSAIIDALLSRDAYRAYFLGNERDIAIEKLIRNHKKIMEKTYKITF